ncbi:hypothetical protein D3C86_1600930 [compost metagenome]
MVHQFSGACGGVVLVEGDVGLPEPLGQKRKEGHHRQTDVQAPEGDRQQPLAPDARIGQATHAVEHQTQAQHAIDPEQCRVAMASRRVQPLHVIEGDRRIDQEAKQPRADQVPEKDGGEEAEGPVIDLFPLVLTFQLGAVIGLKANDRERHDLQRRQH